MTPHQTLQWRHNEDNGVSNHRCLERFTQPFVQAQIKDIPSCVFFMMFYFRQQNNVLRMYDVLVVIVGHLLDHCNIWKRIVFSLTGRWLPITNSPHQFTRCYSITFPTVKLPHSRSATVNALCTTCIDFAYGWWHGNVIFVIEQDSILAMYLNAHENLSN